MDSIVRFGLREGAASARDRIGGKAGNQGDGSRYGSLPHGEERILRASNHEPRFWLSFETRACARSSSDERNCAHAGTRDLSRAISAGVGIPSQRRNFVQAGCFSEASEPRLFQFPVDPQGCPVSPADYGQPTQGTSESDQRRHRSILVVHALRPCSYCRASRPRLQSHYLGPNGAVLRPSNLSVSIESKRKGSRFLI